MEEKGREEREGTKAGKILGMGLSWARPALAPPPTFLSWNRACRCAICNHAFGRNLRSNVSDAQINFTLGQNFRVFRCSPSSRPLIFGSAESEHLRLTNREIISEEFQPM